MKWILTLTADNVDHLLEFVSLKTAGNIVKIQKFVKYVYSFSFTMKRKREFIYILYTPQVSEIKRIL